MKNLAEIVKGKGNAGCCARLTSHFASHLETQTVNIHRKSLIGMARPEGFEPPTY